MVAAVRTEGWSGNGVVGQKVVTTRPREAKWRRWRERGGLEGGDVAGAGGRRMAVGPAREGEGWWRRWQEVEDSVRAGRQEGDG
uniref:DUF834 domain-containing protein n=1 Tax=Setaria viridis TaxID=4556 RepID=A0A4U6UG71_SETVI|nr:hypothetical protein SEVIR_5G160850v2 [Setaria viridis]